jgi:hypothetical protein
MISAHDPDHAHDHGPAHVPKVSLVYDECRSANSASGKQEKKEKD